MSIALLGCGGGSPDSPANGFVEGVVTMDGQPLADVMVSFEPQDVAIGAPSTGRTDGQGHYELTCGNGSKGAVIATHKVTITTTTENPTPPGEEYHDPIPARYNTESELVHEVKAGSNLINLELTSQ